MKKIILLLLVIVPVIVHAQTPVADSLQQALSVAATDKEKVNLLNKIANEYTRTDFSKAKEYLYKAIALAKSEGLTTSLSSSYMSMTLLCLNNGHADSSTHYLNELMQLSQLSANDSIRANYTAAAGLYYKNTGNYKQALEIMKAAMQNPVLVNNKISLAGHLLNLGGVCMLMEDYKQCVGYYLQSLSLFEQARNQRGQSFVYQNLAEAFFKLKRYNEALSYAMQSLALKKRLVDNRGAATANLLTGQIYKSLNNPPKAIAYDKEALNTFRSMNLVYDEAEAMFEIAGVYKATGEDSLAQVYYLQSADKARLSGDSSIVVFANAELNLLHHSAAQKQQEEQQLKNSLQSSIGNGNSTNELELYKYLSEYYTANKAYDKALGFTNKYYLKKDSLENAALLIQIKQMESRYNLEKKDHEITTLNKDRQLKALYLQKQKILLIVLLCIIIVILFLAIGYFIFRRNRQLRTRLEQQQILNFFATSLYGKNTIESIAGSITNNCVGQLHFRNCAFYMLSAGRKILERKAFAGDYAMPLEIPVNENIDACETMTGEAVIENNIAAGKSYTEKESVNPFGLYVPVKIDGITEGFIISKHNKKYFYTETNKYLLKEIAGIAAQRIHKYLVEEKLRTYIARDLHDDVGSVLSSINIMSKVALNNIDKKERINEQLLRINESSSSMLENLSDVVWAINPLNDSPETLIFKMKEFAAGILEPVQIQYKFTVDDNVLNTRLNLADRKTVYLVFKEAVNNAAKHSGASEVSIYISGEETGMRISVRDNGKGFDAENAAMGNGIYNMKQRLSEAGGTLAIESAGGCGTSIVMNIRSHH